MPFARLSHASIILLLWASSCSTATASSSLEIMLDVMAQFATGAPFDRDYLNELLSCWEQVDPLLEQTQNRMWEGFLNFSEAGGNPDGSDPWFPQYGCEAMAVRRTADLWLCRSPCCGASRMV